MPMTIGICDDDQRTCVLLAQRARHVAPECSIRVYRSAAELLEEAEFPDILLLDILMPGMSGMDAARTLRERGCEATIIFISGDDQYVFRAFDVNAFHYLVKPFDDARLREVLERACEARRRLDDAPERRRITIKSGGVSTSVLVRDILFAEVFNRRIVLHTTKGDVESYGRLSELEKELGDGFFRTHRAFLVSLEHVEGYTARSVRVGGQDVLMARKNYPLFTHRYMEYVRETG